LSQLTNYIQSKLTNKVSAPTSGAQPSKIIGALRYLLWNLWAYRGWNTLISFLIRHVVVGQERGKL